MRGKTSLFDKQPQRNFKLLGGLTPDSVDQLLMRADYDALGQARLFSTIIQTDSEVRGAISQRVLCLLGGKWNFIPADGAGKRDSKRAIKALKCKGLRGAIKHLGKYSLYGYSAVEIIYNEDGSGVPERLRPVPWTGVNVRDGRIMFLLAGKWIYYDEDAELRSRLIVCLADENDPAGEAVMRAVAPAWIVKIYALRDWALYSERLGDPPLLAKYKQGTVSGSAGEKPEDLILAALRKIRSHGYAAIQDTITVDLLADNRLEASRAFSLLIDTAERWEKRAILTSESTMQSGDQGQGSRAADSVRAEYGIETLVQADADVVTEALVDQYVKVVLGFMGIDPDSIEVSTNWKRELPTMQQVKAACDLKNAHFSFDEKPVLEELGFIPMDPPTIDVGPVTPSPTIPSTKKRTQPNAETP